MTYPVINLRNANEVFKSVDIEIKAHPLGYFEADVKGTVHSRDRLGALVEELMQTYFRVPEQRQSPDASTVDVEPGYDEWQEASERRHTQAGIL